MNSEINDQYLTTVFHNFSNETQRLLNLIKNETDEKKNKELHKQINLIHNIELSIVKLRTIKNKK